LRAAYGETPDFDLNAQDVHVWSVSLDSVCSPHRPADLLSRDELARADRFRAGRDRRQFIVCRGVLRCVLSRYLGDPPASLEFRYGPYGKPALKLESGELDLRFSVSHCRDQALFAIALSREVGVDVECVRPDVPAEDIAARFFSAREAAAIEALPPADRLRAFFRVWTRKEAFLKAQGHGFSAPLRDFTFSCDATGRVLWTGPDPAEASRWRLDDVDVGADHAAAVAAEGTDWGLRRREWV
jgi:4'-phosphopantetheinyl transferase